MHFKQYKTFAGWQIRSNPEADATGIRKFKCVGKQIFQNLFKSHGIIGVPLVDVKARFLAASTYGDELLAESTVTEFRGSSFVVRHNFLKEKALAVEGYEIRVWTGPDPKNPERMKSQKLPREVIERFTSPPAPAT